jgi:hypothetical protein
LRLIEAATMRIPTYDIFSGRVDKEAVWIEAVEGFGLATDRMKELAREKAGAYFVFSMEMRKVLASIETFEEGRDAKQSTA